MLVKGTYEYFDDIHNMALSFFEASPYKDLEIDNSRVADVIHLFLDADPYDKIIILWLDNDRPVGVLAATAEMNIFNRKRFAGELIWWIEPEHRKAGIAEQMRKAFEYWANGVHCQSAVLVDVLGNLDKYYTRKGYERRETSYLKVL